MAYKDEYEVARLYTDGRFHEKLAQEFEGKAGLRFHLAPPIFGKRDVHGQPVKQAFGPWMMHGFRVLVALRKLRGTPFDIFGRTAERRQERRLIEDYRLAIEDVLARWKEVDANVALALARVPEQIRGYGHIKDASIGAARIRWEALARQLPLSLAASPSSAGTI